MSVVGERTAEESSPPGVVEEPGVSRGLMLNLFSTAGLLGAVRGLSGIRSFC